MVAEIEWQQRKEALRAMAKETFSWAIKNGVSEGSARHSMQAVVLAAIGSAKVRE